MPRRITRVIAAKKLSLNCPHCNGEGSSDGCKTAYAGRKCSKKHYWRWCPICKHTSVSSKTQLQLEVSEGINALKKCGIPIISKHWQQLTQYCHNKACECYMQSLRFTVSDAPNKERDNKKKDAATYLCHHCIEKAKHDRVEIIIKPIE